MLYSLSNNYLSIITAYVLLLFVGLVLPFLKPIYSVLFLIIIMLPLTLMLFYKGIWLAIVVMLFAGPLFPYTYYFDHHRIFHHGGAYPGFVITPTYLAIFASIGLIIIFYHKRLKNINGVDKSIFIWLIFGLVSFILSFVFSVSLKASFFDFNNMIIVSLVSIMLYLLITDENQLKTIINIIGIFLILESSIAFLQQVGLLPKDLIFGSYAIHHGHGKGLILFISEIFVRPCGTLKETNTLAKLLSMYIPIYFVLSLIEKNLKSKAFYIVVLTFSLFALLLTLGRSSIIGAIVGSLYSLFLVSKFSSKNLPSKKFMITSTTVIIVITAVIVMFLFKMLYLRFFVFGYLTVSGRMAQYENAIFIIKHHFLTGIGLNNYDFVMILNDITGEAAAEPQFPAHNLYLLYFAETGIIGISLFFAFIASIYHSVIFALKKNTGANNTGIYTSASIIGGIGGLTSIFVLSLFGWGFRSITLYSVFFLLGLVLSAINISYQKIEKD